jgi:hypothetical protein
MERPEKQFSGNRSGGVSKGRVWNKGKRNGGGGPPKADKVTGSPQEVETTPTIKINVEHRTERIKPMNRDNWVSRPPRSSHEKAGTAENKEGPKQ